MLIYIYIHTYVHTYKTRLYDMYVYESSHKYIENTKTYVHTYIHFYIQYIYTLSKYFVNRMLIHINSYVHTNTYTTYRYTNTTNTHTYIHKYKHILTCWISGKSKPLAAISVATRTSFFPSL